MGKLAFLGPDGTFSGQAAAAYDPQAKLVPCESNPRVVRAVLEGVAEESIFAIENNLGGMVVDSLEPMMEWHVGWALRRSSTGSVEIVEARCVVIGESVIPISHCLYGPNGTNVSLSDVEIVFSHPQVFFQSNGYLEENLPQARRVPTTSTVAAIPQMLESKISALAIAPWRAGELYPVDRVADGIEDISGNETRFSIVGKKMSEPTGHDKTSIWFSVPGDTEAGALVKVLQVFDSGNINMGMINTRPAKTTLGKYVFPIDLDGHWEDRVLRQALEFITAAGLVTNLQVMGSYPRYSKKKER